MNNIWGVSTAGELQPTPYRRNSSSPCRSKLGGYGVRGEAETFASLRGRVVVGFSQRLVLAGVLTIASVSSGQSSTPSPQSPAPPAAPGATGPQAPDTSPAQPDIAPAVQGDQPAAQGDQSDGFVFKKRVEEVVLHATVVDAQNHLVTDLSQEKFEVYEDGKLQKVTSFRKESVPVALGILIDNSGSMVSERAKVNEAAQRVETRGRTALDDAVIAGVGHLSQSSQMQKKVLLVLPDGGANPSRATFEE